MKTDWPIEIDHVFGCWLWRSKLDRDGYGVSYRGKDRRLAHIAVYVEAEGSVADGMELDHQCRRPQCVNPEHLEPVTRSENERRKSWRVRARKTKCKRGHSLKLNGIVTPTGGIVCRLCMRNQQQGAR